MAISWSVGGRRAEVANGAKRLDAGERQEPATPTRCSPSLAGFGATGAVIQIATERVSMSERAQEILDMLGGVVVLQGRVDGA